MYPMLIGRFVLWAVVGSVLGAAFALPRSVYSPLLAWSYAVLFVILYRACPRPRWWEMLGMGVTMYAVGFYWLPKAINTFSDFSLMTSLLCALLLFTLASLQFVVINWLAHGLSKGRFASYSATIPCAWFATEVFFPKLIPWHLADTQLQFVVFAQSADLIGVALLSGLMLWWAQLLVDSTFFLRQRKFRSSLQGICLLLITAGSLYLYGNHRIASVEQEAAQAPSLKVGILQGNLDPIDDFLTHKRDVNIDRYRTLSDELLRSHRPHLLIWPESSVGYDYFPDETKIEPTGSRFPYPGRQVPLLFGGQTKVRTVEGQKQLYYNSAFLITASGEFLGVYHKQILFPFSEHDPFSGALPFASFYSKKNHELLPGEDRQPLQISRGESRLGRPISIAMAICFEDMWSKIFLEQLRSAGADLLVTLSNDNWFLESAAAEQHHLIASWRAIELRRYLVRAGNSGVTAAVDPLGRQQQRLPTLEQGSLFIDNVKLLKTKSLYALGGLWPARFLAVFFAIFGFAPYLLRRVTRSDKRRSRR